MIRGISRVVSSPDGRGFAGGCGPRRLHDLDGCRRRRDRLGARRIGERHEALDVLDADQVREERHQLQRLGEFAVAHRLARLALRLELENFLARDFQHPAGRPVVLRPRLHACVGGIARARRT